MKGDGDGNSEGEAFSQHQVKCSLQYVFPSQIQAAGPLPCVLISSFHLCVDCGQTSES